MEDTREKLLYDCQLLGNNKNINIKQHYKKSPALFNIVRNKDVRNMRIGDEYTKPTSTLNQPFQCIFVWKIDL